ncbi:MAG TPA: MYXO-CTERM sorting domain-containing protein [Nannocystaceae bacterium]|nr:MYXO-CTERM sorting domain-containing protein [Nannocystaceae bacterium]
MRWMVGVGWVCALGLASGSAWAGDTSSSSDDGSSSSADGGSSSTAPGTGGITFGDEDCGGECSGEGGVMIVAPATTDVTSPFTVTATPLTGCSCDDCGCFNDEPSGLTVWLDGVDVGGCQGSGSCSIEVEATAGTHELQVLANYSFHSEGETLTIAVTGAPPGDEGTTTDDAQTGANADGEKSGCGCSTSPTHASGGLLLMLLAALRSRRGQRGQGGHCGV